MVEHYSKKIQNVIQTELFKAKSSIKIVVAWFTNDLLFQPLVLKQQAGVKVEIILNRDEINDSEENGIDFNELVNVGGILRWNETKQLMHDKFCIIDDSIVIYGSYNWTNKAEYNEESITVSKNESETIRFYLEKFSKLSEKYPAIQSTLQIVSSPIIQTEPIIQKKEMSIPIDINELSKERKKRSYILRQCSPMNLGSYNALAFYEKIDIVRVGISDVLIGRAKGSYYFICPLKWSPYNDVEFTDYKRDDNMGKDTIWIKVFMKWGLFVTSVRKFAFEPICDEIILCNGNTVFRIINKWGLLDNYGRLLLECKYDGVLCIGNDEYRINLNGKSGVYKKGIISFS